MKKSTSYYKKCYLSGLERVECANAAHTSWVNDHFVRSIDQIGFLDPANYLSDVTKIIDKIINSYV